MSFSIRARAKTKQEVLDSLEKQFNENVLAHQPSHAADKEQALAVAYAYLDIVVLKSGHEFDVMLSGGLSWQAVGEDGKTPIEYTTANVSCSVGQVHTPA